jgi:hypothetical protein
MFDIVGLLFWELVGFMVLVIAIYLDIRKYKE